MADDEDAVWDEDECESCGHKSADPAEFDWTLYEDALVCKRCSADSIAEESA